jgi:hypothetical protein
MQKHIKAYLDYFDLGEQDLIACEFCMKEGRVDGSGFDIHHIAGRVGKDANDIKNLICLCRKHHDMVHAGMPKSEVRYIHNFVLTGRRKIFIK